MYMILNYFINELFEVQFPQLKKNISLFNSNLNFITFYRVDIIVFFAYITVFMLNKIINFMGILFEN